MNSLCRGAVGFLATALGPLSCRAHKRIRISSRRANLAVCYASIYWPAARREIALTGRQNASRGRLGRFEFKPQAFGESLLAATLRIQTF